MNPLPEPWRDPTINPWAAKTELVPTEFLAALAPGNGIDERHLRRVMADVLKHGFREAIPLSYAVESRTIRMDEGNHRLEAAKRLGLAGLPVRFCRKEREYAFVRDLYEKGILDPNGLPFLTEVPGITPDQHGYVPADLSPSQIGVPTTRVESGGLCWRNYIEHHVNRAGRFYLCNKDRPA